MKFFVRLLLALALLIPAQADAKVRGAPQTGVAPPFGLRKTVINMQYGADQYANIAKNMTISLGSNTPANLSSTGYPSGVLNGNIGLSQTAMPQNYFGHYSMTSVGNAILNVAFVPPLIVYNGGNSVQSVSPSNTGVSSTGGAGISLLPNGNWNVEFAFGDIITAVADNGSGLVRLTLSNSSSMSTVSTGTQVQVHNVTNLSQTTVWTVTKIDNTHADLQGSTYSGTMAVVGGGPGPASEMIVQIPSVTWSFLQSTTGFTNANNTISDWVFCKTADLAGIQAGNVLSTGVINSLNTLQPAWLRFMDAIGVQASSGQFQYLPASNVQSYDSRQWLPDYYGGTTAGTADDFTIAPGPLSPTSGAYFDGEIIQFKTDRATVGRLPTLAINGRSSGAKPIIRDQTETTNFLIAGSTTPVAITSISGSGTVATVTTTAPHGFTVGQKFLTTVSGNTPSGFNGSNILATSTGASAFTYSNATSGSTSVAGTFTPQIADGDIINTTFTASNMPSGAYLHKYYVNLATASFTATITGKILTVTAVSSGTITPGQKLTGTSLSNTVRLLPYGNASTTGTGGTGTYAVDVALTSGTVTGATSSTASDCGSGVVNSINALLADMSCVLSQDAILGGRGYIFGSDTSVSSVIVFYPAGLTPMTPSATITSASAAAETVAASRGTLSTATVYTAQYRKIFDAWYVTSGQPIIGLPMPLLKEYATRSGAGIWYTIPLTWSKQSAQDFGTYMATNWPGIKVGLEIANEIWNTGQAPDHLAQSLGVSLGFAAVADGLYFRSVMSYQGWATVNIAQVAIDAYVAAGGSRSNITLMIQNSGSDGDGGAAFTGGGQTNLGLPYAWNGTLLTPTPATFTGTITPNTNGNPATLTVTGISGVIYPGFEISGAGVTAGTKISSCSPQLNVCIGNGTYQLDTVYGGTVGPVAMTATNTTYSTLGGSGYTSTSTAYNAYPTRPIDYADAVGYAIYYDAGIVRNGAGTWNGAQSQYTPILQASLDYAQGVATANNTLIQSALNVWSADTRTKMSRSGNYRSTTLCGYLSSPTTFGFCDNAAPATFTATAGGTDTMTVTAVASGTIGAGQRVIGTSLSNSPIILPYGTGGTTGVGGTGTYKLGVALTSGTITGSDSPIGTAQGFANYAALYDGAGRPSGKANLNIIQYEGSIQQNFCSGNPCSVGDISLSTDTPTLAGQFTSNGWALDATYGYPSFGAGNTVTAGQIIALYLAYVNSTQYYNDSLLLYQGAQAISASRPFFGPAQYGVLGSVSGTATTYAPQWGLYPGSVTSTPLQNYNAQVYFNTNWLLKRDLDPASNDNDPVWLEKAA